MMGSYELSDGIIFEILSRVTSLKTLDTCKLVCKEWKKMISEPNFMSTLTKRTKIVYGYFIQDLTYIRSRGYVSEFVFSDDTVPMCTLPKHAEILACSSTQGILCCRELRRYFVVVPVTGERRALPTPKAHPRTAAMAIIVMRSQPLHFKIIRLWLRQTVFISLRQELAVEFDGYRCEIFDSETSAWRKKREDVRLPCGEDIASNPAVYATNGVHWLTTRNNILSYNPTNNSFHKFSLPENMHEKVYPRVSVNLFEYEGELRFTNLSENGEVDLWMIDDIENCVWKKKISISIESLQRFAYPVGIYNAYVALLKAYSEIEVIKLEDLKLDRIYSRARRIFPFRSKLLISTTSWS